MRLWLASTLSPLPQETRMPIAEYPTKPWVVSCDQCGDYLGEADTGGWEIFDTREDAEERAVSDDWLIEGDVVTCHGCQEAGDA